MLQESNRRMRRVNAISDYLESARKGKNGEEDPEEEGRVWVERKKGKKRKESELWIAGETASNLSNCASDFLQSQHMAD